jgi:poly(A) polymerase
LTRDTSSEQPTIYTAKDHQLTSGKVDNDVFKIISRLKECGFEAYIVGGGVRDLLLGNSPKDFDIATSAKPKEIRALFRNSRIIGKRFLIAHIFFYGRNTYEITTFRDLGVDDDNVYGTASTDAFRRDITINALFYDPIERLLIDYVGGYPDLKNKLVRVIGDPKTRFEEDPVRLLRVVRHAARNDFTIEATAKKALLECQALLHTAHKVRVYDELKKDILSGRSAKVLPLLFSTGILSEFLPDLKEVDAETIEALKHFDLIAPIYEGSTALFFALILLLSTKGNYGEAKDKLPLAFAILQIPRREGERLEEITTALEQILNNPDSFKVTRKGALQTLTDLDNLLKVLPPTSRDRELFRNFNLVKKRYKSRNFER